MSRRAARLRLAGLAAIVLGLFAVFALTGDREPERVSDALDPLGAGAPFAFVAASSLLTVCLVPGPLLAAASGILFGTVAGTPLAIVSATIGACLCFTIARRGGADAMDALAGERARKVQAWIERRGFYAVFYLRLMPGVPFGTASYASGLTRVPLGVFAVATAIGCAPRAFAYTALGGSLDDLGSPEAISAMVVLVVMAIVGGFLLRRDLRAEPSGG